MNKPGFLQFGLTGEKASRKARIAADLVFLSVGFLFFVLPYFFPDVTFIYSLSPWVWITAFLAYLRINDSKKSVIIFFLVFLAANELRYRNCLGSAYSGYSVMLLVVVAMVYFIPFLAEFIYRRIGSTFWFIFVFPTARVLIELFMAVTRLGGQFNLMLSEVNDDWLLQDAALYGEFVISFLICLIPSVTLYLLFRKKKRKRSIIACLVVILLIIPMHFYGKHRLDHERMADTYVTMAWSEGIDSAGSMGGESVAYPYEQISSYVKTTIEEAAAGGAGLLTYVEEAFFVSDTEAETLIEETCAKAKECGIYVLLTLETYDDDENDDGLEHNKAVFIDPEGNILSIYNKHNLVPIIEDLWTVQSRDLPQSHEVTIDGQTFILSYTICYDGDFSTFVQHMDNNTTVYIDPSWDWEEIQDLNYRMLTIRGVENGVTVFKPTRDGYTTVTDMYGRTVSKTHSNETDDILVNYVSIPLLRTNTLYKHIADHINYGYLAFGIFLVLLRIIVNIKRKKKKEAAAL